MSKLAQQPLAARGSNLQYQGMTESYLAPSITQQLVEAVPSSFGPEGADGWATVLELFLRIADSPFGCIALVRLVPGRNYDWLAVRTQELEGDSEPMHLPGSVRSKVQQECIASRRHAARYGVVQGFRSGNDYYANVLATPILAGERVLGFVYAESLATLSSVCARDPSLDPQTIEAFGRFLGSIVSTRLPSE